ncbi:MAG: LOG family protein [Sedimentisphaerales bacterium]|nr:LOG family protein [Sedimentisphaerales bacterium]
MDKQKVISIFGTSKAVPGDEVFTQAGDLGFQLAKNGFTIANGGYGGTMLASASGAVKAGGQAIGITCTAFGRSGPNEYITRNITTNSLPERLNKLLEIADGYVVLTGGTGTLLELATIWELKNKHFPNADKPIIIMGRFWKPLLELMASEDPDSDRHIEIADSVTGIVSILEKYF